MKISFFLWGSCVGIVNFGLMLCSEVKNMVICYNIIFVFFVVGWFYIIRFVCFRMEFIYYLLNEMYFLGEVKFSLLGFVF